jgi:hypothetical protein
MLLKVMRSENWLLAVLIRVKQARQAKFQEGWSSAVKL